MILSRSLLVFAGAAFLLLGVAFVWCAVAMVKSNRSDILVSAPVVPVQEVRLASTGTARILLESPRTSAEYRNMRIELVDKQSGQSVMAGYSMLAAQAAVYGVTTMQVPIGPTTLLRAGEYIVRIGGLQAGNDYSRYRLMISRPYIGRLALQITVLVLCGVGMMLDLIWVSWMAGWMKPAPPTQGRVVRAAPAQPIGQG